MLSSILVACVPYPNRHYFAPTIIGVVRNGDNPVPNAEVRLSGEFTDKDSITVTDSNGRFKIGPLTEMRLSVVLIGDPLYGYSLHIKLGDKEYTGISENLIGYSLKDIVVACDLSKPIQVGKRQVFCSHNKLLEPTR